jgi:ABC-type dipeptide/oligopeptide/nickel transport system permease component
MGAFALPRPAGRVLGRVLGRVVGRVAGRVVLAVAGAGLAYLLAAAALHPRAVLESRSPRPPAAVVTARLRALNADDRVPLLRRYAVWMTGVARGDFGSTLDGAPVGDELWRRAGASLRLVTAGALLGTAGGIAAGAWAAGRPYGRADRLVTACALTTLSIPVFALAVLLQTAAQWVNTRTGVHALEWTGEYTPAAGTGTVRGLADRVRHLILPTATIALGQTALYARYQRATMLDALRAGYVTAAMARGLSRRKALRRHALRVAVIPTTTFATYGFAALLTGAAVTEKIYAWHGLGEWLIDSIGRNDVNAVAACGGVAAVSVAAATTASDLARLALDPRTRP